MNPRHNAEYTRIIEEVIKRLVRIFGSNVVFTKLKNIKGISIDKRGEVLVQGDEKGVFDNIVSQFGVLSPVVVKRVLAEVIAGNPELKGFTLAQLYEKLKDSKEQQTSSQQKEVSAGIAVADHTPSLNEVLSQDEPLTPNVGSFPAPASVPSKESSAPLDEVKTDEVEKMFHETLDSDKR